MKKAYYLLSTLLISVAFTACKKGDDITPEKGIDLVLTATEQQKVSADNGFTLKMFKTLNADNANTKNLFISPLSMSFALGMTTNGANGATLTAMRNTLNFNNFSQTDINSYYSKIITDLPKLDPAHTTLSIANSIWYRQGFNVLPQFTETNSNYYQANVQALDFNSPTAPQQINSWVNNKTNGKIPTIVNTIAPTTFMYLINAIYFKSTWREPFDAANTKKQTFYTGDNSTVQADFMKSLINLNFYHDNTITIAELPYADSKFSMVILQPENGKTVAELATGIDSTKWVNWMSKLAGARMNVVMPKFKYSYSAGLLPSLTTLGMGLAFTSNADFSKINSTPGLQITDVIHKAYVDVNEKGTEAAAVTAVVIGVTSVLNSTITIDHPFVFVIREMKTGLILFVGTMNNPLSDGN